MNSAFSDAIGSAAHGEAGMPDMVMMDGWMAGNSIVGSSDRLPLPPKSGSVDGMKQMTVYILNAKEPLTQKQRST